MKQLQVHATVRYGEYAQSANVLFHFMDRFDYLRDSLERKALVPRYCVEDLSYLSWGKSSPLPRRIAVLEKCFCDIPFHQLYTPSKLELVKAHALSSSQAKSIPKEVTHPEFYGKFAIALTKQWGEDNCLQSVQYINQRGVLNRDLSAALGEAYGASNVNDIYAAGLLSALVYMKPIRGLMSREFDTEEGRVLAPVVKNFHDEREWRYVPDPVHLEAANRKLFLSAPPDLAPEELKKVNDEIASDECQLLHLKYEYADIRYLVVPDSKARDELLRFIAALPVDHFDASSCLDHLKLASTIRVLSELREDV